jgi:serine/threonine-protein kinase ATR
LGDATNALDGFLVTQSAVPRVAPQSSDGQGCQDKCLDVAKTLLLLARWVHHTGQKQKKDVLNLYQQVRCLQPQWEKGYFFVARYYDDLLVDARRRQEENPEPASDVLQVKLYFSSGVLWFQKTVLFCFLLIPALHLSHVLVTTL